MKADQILALMGLASVSVAQSLPPAPTESIGCAAVETGAQVTTSASASVHPDLPPAPTQYVGCEPHGDHWHCEGPAPASNATTSSAGTTGDDAAASSTPSDVTEAGAANVAAGMGVVAVAALLAL
ncbi:hypothetical protein VdG1_07391 [Verticillium dahliae VDG1]|nr:hypothetical protein VdG1_07391 [Verticillium dahliae VDG1]